MKVTLIEFPAFNAPVRVLSRVIVPASTLTVAIAPASVNPLPILYSTEVIFVAPPSVKFITTTPPLIKSFFATVPSAANPATLGTAAAEAPIATTFAPFVKIPSLESPVAAVTAAVYISSFRPVTEKTALMCRSSAFHAAPGLALPMKRNCVAPKTLLEGEALAMLSNRVFGPVVSPDFCAT